mgnify:FL=1
MSPLKETTSSSYSNEKSRFRRAWKDSHGNGLLGFAGILFLIGVIMIWASPPRDDELEIGLLPEVGGDPGIVLPSDALLIRVTTDQLNSRGPIRIAVYDSEDSFGDPTKAIIKDSLVPVDGLVAWEIKLDILPETFAVAAYHDLDDNGKLNRALFNAPAEPYGFSNNARNVLGPPTYDQTIMNRPDDSSAIEIRVY